ncbi:GIY-YIG nuclease family protein [Domibacillus sp.]|uniref:GIY-YIG nuclease family protein n=1 Tax=Domibacillus sp. TaxID=1969783 RepID=UPI0028118C14|nr:GIY-YIG nuclease family protein [Domibacillus sp.]
MERKRELKQQFKEMEIEAGVYEIKNTINQKIFIGSTRNFKTLNGRKFELEAGSSTNKALQKEWNKFGKEAFQFTILEQLKKPEEKWLAEKQLYGEKGYNGL